MKIIKRLLFSLFLSIVTFLGVIIFCITMLNVVSTLFRLFEIENLEPYFPEAYKAIKVCAGIGSLIGFLIGLKIGKTGSQISN